MRRRFPWFPPTYAAKAARIWCQINERDFAIVRAGRGSDSPNRAAAGPVSSLPSPPAAVTPKHDAALQHMWPGLRLLLQASCLRRGHRERPCGILPSKCPELRRRGMNNTDYRWLVHRCWARLAREVKAGPGETRRFQYDVGAIDRPPHLPHAHPDGLLPVQSPGVGCRQEVARQPTGRLTRRPRSPGGAPLGRRPSRIAAGVAGIIKQFKKPSPNQEIILTVLEEEKWPARIDDPLTSSKAVDAKQPLCTIRSRISTGTRSIVSCGFMPEDGTGQGIRWEFVAGRPERGPRTRRAGFTRRGNSTKGEPRFPALPMLIKTEHNNWLARKKSNNKVRQAT